MTRAVVTPVICGVLLHTYAVLFVAEGGLSVDLVGFWLWSCLPYAVASVLPVLRVKPAIAAGFACGVLAGDVFMHYSAIIIPKGSVALGCHRHR